MAEMEEELHHVLHASLTSVLSFSTIFQSVFSRGLYGRKSRYKCLVNAEKGTGVLLRVQVNLARSKKE